MYRTWPAKRTVTAGACASGSTLQHGGAAVIPAPHICPFTGAKEWHFANGCFLRHYPRWLLFDMQPRLTFFWLRPFALFVHRQFLDHRLGNLIISDTSPALGILHQELHVSPLRQVARLFSGFQRFFA